MFGAILNASLGTIDSKRGDYEKIKTFVLSELYEPNGAPKKGVESMQKIVKRQCEKLSEEVADALSELEEEERDGLDESLSQAREISAMEKFQEEVEQLLTIVTELPEHPFGENGAESSGGLAKFGFTGAAPSEDLIRNVVKDIAKKFSETDAQDSKI